MDNEKVIAAAQNALNTYDKASSDIVDIGDAFEKLRTALNPPPPINWDIVEMGDEVSSSDGVSRGRFISTEGAGVVLVLFNGQTVFWSKKGCKLSPSTKRTSLHKHPWPTNGEVPRWLGLEDFILSSFGGACRAKDIDWSSQRLWFAVLENFNEN